MPENIIADTSCLVLLEKIDEFDILQKLYKQVTITPAVADEFGNDLPNWIQLQKPEDLKYQKLLETNVDPGEASAIALAIEIGGLLILDDRRARKLALGLKLDITGTLGILIEAAKSDYISSFEHVLNRIKQTNFYITEELERKLLEMANE